MSLQSIVRLTPSHCTCKPALPTTGRLVHHTLLYVGWGQTVISSNSFVLYNRQYIEHVPLN